MRNIVVTGGTRGLGLAIATRLAGDGDRVICVARHAGDAFESRRAEREAASPGALQFRPFDLTDTGGIPDFVASVTAEFGPLFGLVNNAGIGTSGILATMQDRDIEAILRLNVTAPIMLSKYGVRSMMVGRAGGRIVNISSIVAGAGSSGLSVYAASKAAFGGFTRSLAREVGPLGITVNSVAPGFIITDMTSDLSAEDYAKVARRSALRRLAEAEDVAAAVGYLVSAGARNVTGTTLTVDAGGTA
jgi:3-oxoacyl-[acyl-carrier protein] reductase